MKNGTLQYLKTEKIIRQNANKGKFIPNRIFLVLVKLTFNLFTIFLIAKDNMFL